MKRCEDDDAKMLMLATQRSPFAPFMVSVPYYKEQKGYPCWNRFTGPPSYQGLSLACFAELTARVSNKPGARVL